eukprot:gene26979-35684_t
MSITATEKVNMSLDDIIKLNKKEAPKAKGKPNKGPAAKKTVNAGVKGAANKQRRTSIKGKPANPAAKGVPALRRGLNVSGKATKKDVSSAVKKAVNKICFKPSELSSTTDKVVSQQIRAVLSKQTVGQNRNKNNNNSNPRRQRPGPKGAGLVVKR